MREVLPVTTPSTVPVMVQRHPFESRVQPVAMAEGTTLLSIVRASGIPERFHQFVRVFVNDGEVPRAAWGRVRPRLGATVYVRIVPQGGGGGEGGGRKNILATVLMMVVVVAAAYFAPTLATSLTGLTSGNGFMLAKSMISSGLTMLGAMAISALIPPPTPDSGIPSQMQLLSGVRNQFRPYADIPRIFGKRRVYPLQAARPYTEAQGKDRYLRVLLAVGFGPLKISDIKIGETPIAVYKGVEIEVLEGWAAEHAAFGTLPQGKAPDAAPKLFTSAVTEQQFNVRLEGGNPGAWSTRTTETDADEFSIDVFFSEGLAWWDDKGRRVQATVTIDVEYRLAGSGGAWLPAVWAGNDAADGTQTNGKLICTDRTASPVMRGGRVKLPAKGQYDVRLRRYGTDLPDDQRSERADWTTLRTIRYQEPVSYPGMAMIALRLKATDQLNGVPDTINCVVESYLPTRSAGAWSWNVTRNGAWAFADTLRRRGTEALVPASRLDLPTIEAWAAANDVTAPNAVEPYWTFDAVVERGAIFTVLRQIAAHSRANMLVRDGKYSVVRDVLQTVPVQHITPRNSFAYGGSKAFIDLPHGLKVSFLNAERGFQEDATYVYADGYTKANATKFEALDLPACTSATQAWRDGRYHLAVGRLRPEEHSVTMDIENLRCTVGDLVRLSHDVLQIGVANGRIKGLVTNASNTIGLILEGEVPNFTGKSYVFRVRSKTGVSTLYSVAPAASDADRATLTLSTPVPTSVGPQIGDLFIYGESALESAPMLVKKIEPGPDFTARLTLVDAQDVYSADTGAIPAFNTYVTSDTPVGQLPPPVPSYYLQSDFTAAIINTDGTTTERLAVVIPPQASSSVKVARYEVQFRDTTGSGWTAAESPSGDNSVVYIPTAMRGQAYDVRVRSISETGEASPWVETLAHTVVGITSAPTQATGLNATPGFGVINLVWLENPQNDILHYEIYVSASATAPSAATAGTLTTKATYLADSGLPPATTRHYWVRAVNRSQIKGAWSVGVSTTSLTLKQAGAVSTADLAQLIDATSFAANLEPVKIVTGALPTTKSTNVITHQGKLYRWDGEAYVANVSAADINGAVKAHQIDGKGLDLLDQLGDKVFGSDGTVGPSAHITVNSNQILLSTIAANALVPSINYVGEFASAPTQGQLGASWKQNAVYKNSTDGMSYILTGDPLAWAAYIADGKMFTLGIESSNGTAFKVGQGRSTLLSARLFKNGAEVTDATPASWFRWRRVSIIPQSPPNDDATFNSAYATGYKSISINVDQVFARATFFCDVIST